MHWIYIINAFPVGFILFPGINTDTNALNGVPTCILETIQVLQTGGDIRGSQGPDTDWGLTEVVIAVISWLTSVKEEAEGSRWKLRLHRALSLQDADAPPFRHQHWLVPAGARAQ